MAKTDLELQIEAKQKEVSDKFLIYQSAKVTFVNSKADWDSAVSDLKDLNTQQKVLTDGK